MFRPLAVALPALLLAAACSSSSTTGHTAVASAPARASESPSPSDDLADAGARLKAAWEPVVKLWQSFPNCQSSDQAGRTLFRQGAVVIASAADRIQRQQWPSSLAADVHAATSAMYVVADEMRQVSDAKGLDVLPRMQALASDWPKMEAAFRTLTIDAGSTPLPEVSPASC